MWMVLYHVPKVNGDGGEGKTKKVGEEVMTQFRVTTWYETHIHIHFIVVKYELNNRDA